MVKQKEYKIKKSKLFKEQEKLLPKEVKKELRNVLKQIQKNPINMPNSMSIFGRPSAEELRRWMSRVRPNTIDLVFEYLHDKGCLNAKGMKLAEEFWDKYIKEEQTS